MDQLNQPITSYSHTLEPSVRPNVISVVPESSVDPLVVSTTGVTGSLSSIVSSVTGATVCGTSTVQVPET